jgi:NH3-dependent NAD+ synthetase
MDEIVSNLPPFTRIAWAQVHYKLPCLEGFLTAVPTAELEPITDTYVQSDEADMGMTYDELTAFGRLRKVNKASNNEASGWMKCLIFT